MTLSANATTLERLRGGEKKPEAGARMSLTQINELPRDRQAIAMLDAFKSQLAVALPAHLSADRMARTALTALRQNPALLKCDPTSVFASVLLSAQLGLEIGIDGQAYLVPYKGKCTFIAGWKGYVELVNRAARATVWTGAVFKGDKFEYALGDSPFIRHQPMGESDEVQTNLTHVYAVGRIHDAHWPVIEVWPVSRVIRHRNKFNKVGDSHYSFNNDASFIGYARKVPLMQVLKYMPKSVELRAAMATEGRADLDIREVIEGDWTNLGAAGFDPEAPTGDEQQLTTETTSPKGPDPAGGEDPPPPSSSAGPSPTSDSNQQRRGRGSVE